MPQPPPPDSCGTVAFSKTLSARRTTLDCVAYRAFSALDAAQQSNRVARIVLRGILVADLWIGAALWWGSPHRTAGVSIKPARDLLDFLPFYPIRAYGIILIVLALATLAAMSRKTDTLVRNISAILTGFWAFWFVLYVSAFFESSNASLTVIGYTFIILLGHARQPITEHVLNVRRFTPAQKNSVNGRSNGESTTPQRKA